jgi:hypothetical protein
VEWKSPSSKNAGPKVPKAALQKQGVNSAPPSHVEVEDTMSKVSEDTTLAGPIPLQMADTNPTGQATVQPLRTPPLPTSDRLSSTNCSQHATLMPIATHEPKFQMPTIVKQLQTPQPHTAHHPKIHLPPGSPQSTQRPCH